ncbi:MAG: toll/interleukin-1 receptor domain-containing protein [Gammaproteobacteria bacterium]
MTVFISYRHVDPDQGLADELYRSLVARGHEVFIDKRISIGTEWAREIQQAIAKARFFVVVLSAESILSDMLRQEVALAHERRRAGALTILPVRVDFTGGLGYDLASYPSSTPCGEPECRSRPSSRRWCRPLSPRRR